MNLLLFLIIIAAFYSNNFKIVFWLIFLAGLISDLLFGNLIGFSSLIFLLLGFLIYLYRHKFSTANLLFQLSFVLLLDFIFALTIKHVWSAPKTLVLLIFSLIIFSLINKIKGKTAGLELEV